MNKALLAAILIIVAFAGCSKPDDVKSIEDGIIGTWRRSSGNVTFRNHVSNKDTTIDYWTSDTSCIKDDALEFQANFKGLLHLGAKTCNAGDPESIAFHWEITGGGAGIRLYDAPEYFPIGADMNGTFVTLGTNVMTIRYQTVVVNDVLHREDTLRVTDVFNKQ